MGNDKRCVEVFGYLRLRAALSPEQEIGTEEQLYRQFHECILEEAQPLPETKPEWVDSARKVFIMDVCERKVLRW